jgi:uncharacterized protein YjiS (DUF1127 family)
VKRVVSRLGILVWVEKMSLGDTAMNTAHSAAGLGQTTDSKQSVSSFLESCLVAFQEWRKRGRLQAELCNLSDRGLMDIGITRGEIDYVASNRGTDPRGI